ncbi:MAG: hypothetical protein WD097_08040 [Balneolales bacterium]
MKQASLKIVLLCSLFLFYCERPSSPDFETQHSFDIPLIQSITYKLMGDEDGAIIDTTSEDFADIFLTDSDGMIYLSSEIEFGIGNFDNIVPDIDVNPTDVESEIGLLDVDDFSSSFSSEVGVIESEPEVLDEEEAEIGVFEVEFEGSGSADFETITGSPPVIGVGDPIAAPAEPVVVVIELDAQDFQRAEIEQGAILFTFVNNLGFDLSDLSATLLSNYDDISGTGDAVGSQLVFSDVTHGETVFGNIDFSAGDEVEIDLAIEVTINWEDQNMAANPGDLQVTAEDENLEVRNATANISAQSLDPTSEDLVITNPNFVYAIVSDEPEAGEEFSLVISITNETELPITDAAQTGMPRITILNSDGDDFSGQQVFENETSPGANSLDQSETATVVIDLTGERLTKELSYELDIGTSGGTALTVDQNHLFLINSNTTALKFKEVRSDIDEQSDIVLEDSKMVEGDFVEAEVEEGSLILEFRNESNIPLMIDHMRFFNENEFVAKNTGRFFAEGTDIGEIDNVEIPPQSTVTEEIPLEGVGISNHISYSGVASSPGTDSPETVFETDLIVTNLDGSVQLRSASSVLDPQDFSTGGDVEIAEEDFQLTSDNHYVEVSSGLLRISDIVNEIDMDIDTLIISFPNIRVDSDGSGQYSVADSLWFELSGEDRIRRSSDTAEQPVIEQALDNVRIYASNNKVVYNVVAITENTRIAEGADTIRTVRSTDRFVASVDIQDLGIKTAFGKVQKRVELLNDDNGTGILNIHGDEAEVTDMEDLDALSDNFTGIKLFNPSFDLFYDTNLGVKGTIIAAILGTNKDGEEVYLSGLPGSDMEVEPDDEFDNLHDNMGQLDRSKLIKFEIDPVESNQIGAVLTRVLQFDSESTNVEDFLSNLPNEIRFVGKVIVNPDNEEGFVVDPIEFNTNMGIDIPINLSTAEGEPASLENTLSVDLSDLPSQDDDLRLSKMTLYISYDNGLPFATDMQLYFLDANENMIKNSAGVDLDPVNFNMNAAQVDQNTRFVSQARSGVTEISITGDDLDYLYQTRNLRLDGSLATSRDELSGEVKLRSNDFIKVSVSASFQTTIRVN